MAVGYAFRSQPQPPTRRPAPSTAADAPPPAIDPIPPPAAIADRPSLPMPVVAADPFQPGSVWESPAGTGDRVFTLLERDGERFKAMFVLGKIVREIHGTIRDGRVRWRASDVRAIAGGQGHDQAGDIKGREMAMVFTDPATGRVDGRYALELRKPAPDGSTPTASAFRPLFNGRDLTGWAFNPAEATHWGIEDGQLVVRGTGRQHAFLLSEGRYSDFLLKFEVQLPPDSDSGIMIRAEPGDNPSSMEVNLRNFPSDPPGLHADTGAFRWSTSGRGPDYAKPIRSDLLRPWPAWNAMSVEARGRSIRVVLNGQLVQDFDLETVAANPKALPSVRRREGRVGFQSHTGTVQFRNVEIRDLSAPPASGSVTSGTQVEDLKVGTGPTVKPGDEVTVHYIGRLADGRIFDDSRQRGQPLQVALVGGRAIKGWIVGLSGMRVGWVRRLIVPPEEAYGERGSGTAIPPYASLRFEVELLGVH
jgi:hypothetical protein